MKPSLRYALRDGFLKRNLDQISLMTARVVSVGGLNTPIPEVEMASFRDGSLPSRALVFTDQGHGGFSTADLEAMQFTPEELPPDYIRRSPDEPLPYYGRFTGNINTDLPPNRPDIERSGYAAWRTPDPSWTVFGKALFNCDAQAFLALRLKSDGSKYFINMQSDSIVVTDLYQHRLFAKTPGQWETVYVPFSEFVRTHMGGVLKNQGHIPKDNISTVGLGLIDRIPGPFELCIDRIWATNKREFEDTQEVD